MFQSRVSFIHILISCGNVINIKISPPPPFFFKAIYVPLSEYHRGICSARMVPISQSANRLLRFRDGTADVTYCADVTLFLHATSGGLSLTVAFSFLRANFLCFIALNAIWPHFLGTKLRFYQIVCPLNTLNKTNWREMAKKKKLVFWRESRIVGRRLIIVNKSIKETLLQKI